MYVFVVDSHGHPSSSSGYAAGGKSEMTWADANVGSTKESIPCSIRIGPPVFRRIVSRPRMSVVWPKAKSSQCEAATLCEEFSIIIHHDADDDDADDDDDDDDDDADDDDDDDADDDE